ncbi:MAG: efflux RND transporter periplasmic adaptor subunit [Phycisphaerales bacterium]
MWKWMLGGLLVLIGLCGGGSYLAATSDPGKRFLAGFSGEAAKTEVRVDPVIRGNVIRVVSAPGTVEPKTKVQISAQVVARIIALPFREGDQVRKGDAVARLDAEDLAAALDSARASLKGEQARLEGLKADLANAESELARTRGLFETKDVSKAALDTAESMYLRMRSAVRQSEHGIEIAQANIKRAEKDLANTVIIAPMDGTLTMLNAEVGELVMIGTLNNAASVIMEIADLSNMLVKAEIDETNIVPVRVGQAVRVFMSAYPDRRFKGSVELVGLKKQVDARDGTGYFETEVLVKQEPGDALRSGLTANVEIEVETFSDVLKVPSQAVVDRRVDELPRALVDGNANVDRSKVFARIVYAFRDGKARAVPVSIGSSDTTHTVIISGLAETDRVITGPYKVLVSIKDDQAVAEQAAKKDAPKDPAQKDAVANTTTPTGPS